MKNSLKFKETTKKELGAFVIKRTTINEIPTEFVISNKRGDWVMKLGNQNLAVFGLIETAFHDKTWKWLEMFIIVNFAHSTLPMDINYMSKLVDMYNDYCLNMGTEIYGVNKDISKEDDDKILQEMKETHLAVEELKNTPDEKLDIPDEELQKIADELNE